MFTYILFATCAVSVVLAQSQDPIASNDGDSLLWICPDREVIETAYFGYCPATTLDDRPLLEQITDMTYGQAPESYKSVAGNYLLTCEYQPTQAENNNFYECAYTAGGGQPLTLTAGSTGYATTCRQPSQNVPQPSPGVDYRRRSNTINKRYTKGDLLYACPWTGNTAGNYLTEAYHYDGKDVTDLGATFSYTCYINYNVDGTSGSGYCSYLQHEDGSIEYVSGTGGPCPSSLCTAIKTGTGNMRRGLYSEHAHLLHNRQVNTTALRELKSRKRTITKR